MISNSIIDRIRNRLLVQNKNWLAIVTGDTGSGKSYSSMSIADNILQKNFNADHVVFNPIDFMKLLTDGNLKKGDIIIFDEAGVGMAARDFMTQSNKLLSAVLQTFRNLNIGVIFTTPNLSFIDVNARKLFHNYFETASINRKTEIAYLKIYDIIHISRIDKTFYKHPRFLIGSRKTMITQVAVRKPRPDLIRDYEKKKTAYTVELNKEVLADLIQNKAEKQNAKFTKRKVQDPGNAA